MSSQLRSLIWLQYLGPFFIACSSRLPRKSQLGYNGFVFLLNQHVRKSNHVYNGYYSTTYVNIPCSYSYFVYGPRLLQQISCLCRACCVPLTDFWQLVNTKSNVPSMQYSTIKLPCYTQPCMGEHFPFFLLCFRLGIGFPA